MNSYLKNAVGPLNDEGEHPLVKDLRTYHANTTAADEIAKHKTAPKSKQEFLQRRKEVATKVSARLGNTPVMALNSYINPSVFDPWLKDPSWLESKKKTSRFSGFAMGNDDHKEEVEELVTGMKPEVEKALVAQWLESVLFTDNDGSMDVNDPEGDEDSR
jgi:DNA topoisomerase IB